MITWARDCPAGKSLFIRRRAQRSCRQKTSSPATRSKCAAMIRASWAGVAPKFVKAMLTDYKRMLKSIKRVTESGLSGEEALMAAFEENAKDVARVGGG